MKITDVRTTMLDVNWGWHRHWLLVRIDTDEGLSGIGEAFPGHVVESYIEAFKPMLLGADPTNVEALLRPMISGAFSACDASHFDGGEAVHAMSGLETALWDLTGKAAGLPVYKLIGGRHRDRVRLYCCANTLKNYLETEDVYKQIKPTCLKFDATPAAIAHVPGVGLDLFMTRKGLREIVGLIERIREAVGDEVELAVEGRCGTLASAMRFIATVERFDLAWVEDLIPPTDVDAWATLTASSPTPTLTGEGLHLRHEFLEYFRKSAVRIIAPDIQVCGGISECKKIADMADLHHMLVCPHNIASPIGTAAALHACAAMPNLLAIEFHPMPGFDRLLRGYRPKIEDGFMEVPEGPGLGVTLDEEEARKHVMQGHTWFD